ncbi:MAG: Mth938-like domain-containing protein [Dehalococcoidia bacterium]
MIDSYRFGEITVRNRTYTSDVIILPDGVRSWWRNKGHELCPDDLDEAIGTALPEVMVIGSGNSEMMAVPHETRRWLESKGIEVIVEGTDKACDSYNQLCRSRNVVAALHLTC